MQWECGIFATSQMKLQRAVRILDLTARLQQTKGLPGRQPLTWPRILEDLAEIVMLF